MDQNTASNRSRWARSAASSSGTGTTRWPRALTRPRSWRWPAESGSTSIEVRARADLRGSGTVTFCSTSRATGSSTSNTAVALDDALAHAEIECVAFRGVAPLRKRIVDLPVRCLCRVTDLYQGPACDHAAGDGKGLSRRLGRVLLGVNQQVKENLFHLSMRAHHQRRFGRQSILHSKAESLPLRVAKL